MLVCEFSSISPWDRAGQGAVSAAQAEAELWVRPRGHLSVLRISVL